MKPKAPNPSPKKDRNNANAKSSKVWLFSLLLTLQYGAQPLISKRCTRWPSFILLSWFLEGFYHERSCLVIITCLELAIISLSRGKSTGYKQSREVIVTSSVLACEVVKVTCALILLVKHGSLRRLFKDWTLLGSLTASGLPAAIYALQNSLLQISYRNLDSLTFSMLNQTKLFFTELFTYIILRQKQSTQQIGALFLLIIAAVLLSVGEGSMYVLIILVCINPVLSGLASALCQWASQVKKHSSYLMTVEMSIIGSLCLLASAYKSPDGLAIKRHGFFYGWTPWTWIPVVLNAVGGILVGLVTTYAGGVRKGFVIVSALTVTALLQFIFDGKPPSPNCLVALPLIATSISIYQKYPYRIKKKES